MNLDSFLNTIKSRFTASGTSTIHPYRDWTILIGVVVIGLVASFAWNTNYFLTLTKQQQEAATSVTEGPDAAATLNTLQKGFEARAQEASRYQSEYLFVDPSN